MNKSNILETIESKMSAPAIKPAPTKIVVVSLEIGRSENVRKALAAMTNEEKAEFLLEMMSVVATAASTGDGRDEAIKTLTGLFGDKFTEHSVMYNCRKNYTLDRQRRVFRCWHGHFGRVTNHGNLTHFDSCGKGLFFHAECDDPETLEQFASLFTDRMVEWTNDYGTLWAGWHG